MQVGTRWSVSATPPSRLSQAMLEAISTVEKELAGFDASDWRWTLTWLEGRPVAELDDGTTVTLDPAGTAVISAADDL